GAMGVGHIDLLWRYAPGNDFITTHSEGVPMDQSLPDFGHNQVITHDSVLALTQLAPDKAAVTFFTRRFTRRWDLAQSGPHRYVDTTFTESFYHTDTISAFD